MCVFSCLTVKTSPEHILAYSNTLSPFSDVRIVQNLWLTELYKQIKKFKLVACLMNPALSVLMSWISPHVQSACYPKLRGPSHWWAKAWTWADWGALRGLRPCLFLFFFSNCNQRSFEWYCVIRVSSFCSLYGARLCTLRNTVFLNFLDLRPIKHTRETSVGLFTQGKSTRKSMAYGFLKCEAVSFSYDPDSLQTMPEKTENWELRTENGMIWV